MTHPSISLIIPVYNRPRLIAECLASLAPALPGLMEVLVIDDGSTDGQTPQATRAAIAALNSASGAAPGAGDKVRFLAQKNAGPGAARNTAAAAARGDWLFFLDSDDLWLPWTLPTLLQAIADHPDAVALFMNTEPFEDPGETGGWTPGPHDVQRFATFFDLRAAKPAPALLGAGYFAVRQAVFAESGGFVPHLRGAEDTDLFYRIAGSGLFLAVKSPAPVARRTSNTDSLTLNMTAVYEGMDFMLRGHRDGRYRDVRPGDVERSLAGIMNFWTRELFWRGYGREAYTLLFRRGVLGLLVRNGYRMSAAKLVFVPVLSILRPKNHRFGWRPKAA